MYNVEFVHVGLFLLRFMVGAFFVLARFRWVYDPSQSTYSLGAENEPQRNNGENFGKVGRKWFNEYRRAHLEWKLCHCGYGKHPVLAAAVALTEILGGLALIFGLLTSLAAFGLMVVTIFATVCTARDKVAKQGPIDRIDWFSCYLWCVEPWLVALCLIICIVGPGLISLDAAVWYLGH